jgi:3-oxoacyl-(acyl-carrier-protein) synthase
LAGHSGWPQWHWSDRTHGPFCLFHPFWRLGKGLQCRGIPVGQRARKLDLFIQYGLAAGFQAVRNAGLEVTDANRERIGVAMGSGIGGLTNIEETSRTLHDSGPRRISPFFVPGSIINMISGFLSIHLGTGTELRHRHCLYHRYALHWHGGAQHHTTKLT